MLPALQQPHRAPSSTLNLPAPARRARARLSGLVLPGLLVLFAPLVPLVPLACTDTALRCASATECRADELCVGGSCAVVACNSDADCPQNGACVLGRCTLSNDDDGGEGEGEGGEGGEGEGEGEGEGGEGEGEGEGGEGEGGEGEGGEGEGEGEGEGDATTATIAFYDCYDFETATVFPSTIEDCRDDSTLREVYDFVFACCSDSLHVVFWNEQFADFAIVEKPFNDVAFSDIAEVVFCDHYNDPAAGCQESLPITPLSATRSAIVLTFEGNYFKLTVVDEVADITFVYELLEP